MSAADRRSGFRRPRVSSFELLEEVSSRFCPPYEVEKRQPADVRIILRDPSDRRSKISVSHRYERRLFLRANYLHIGSTIPGSGPQTAGRIAFRFRGPISRQRSSLRWGSPVADGDRWLADLEGPLLQAVGSIEAIESLTIRWSPERESWRLELKTLSGSMVSGITAFLPIGVPFDRKEALGVIAMVDALASTRV